VGHREQLLEGAKKCLIERGYASTTARDIVAASGTNLASIGYHFGSKDALLTEAMISSLGEWGDEVESVLAEARQADPLARIEAMWAGLMNSFAAQPGLWLSSFEIARVAVNNPVLRKQLADAYALARIGLAQIFLGEHEADDETMNNVGSLIMSTFPGIFGQWCMDPEATPDAAALASGLKRISEILHLGERPHG
jgi:AcrR family transcriptional regulator